MRIALSFLFGNLAASTRCNTHTMVLFWCQNSLFWNLIASNGTHPIVKFSLLERWKSHLNCWQASETFTCGSFMLGASDGKTRTRWIICGIFLASRWNNIKLNFFRQTNDCRTRDYSHEKVNKVGDLPTWHWNVSPL